MANSAVAQRHAPLRWTGYNDRRHRQRRRFKRAQHQRHLCFDARTCERRSRPRHSVVALCLRRRFGEQPVDGVDSLLCPYDARHKPQALRP